ncbi:PTEN [Cordylochernes scorpioides]|uniref:Phosphatidylinositol 3,4,5-trisphosphate 3-phosphatase and dual-specificity protein phosphatase PTEN n=1 Tax=Cordylochernes scorpioides TaxID=51811 RepID=A0ABY6K2A1_9ARAC|nr:PTEN [Cordylochernes scorpioides]
MLTLIKRKVSKNKRRYQEDNYDLDLSYITPNIIAMGFPSQSLESLYRNDITDVARFLEEKHRLQYKIYNLCMARKYDHSKFKSPIVYFPFHDHSPPPFHMIISFCLDVHQWLSYQHDNVVAVHCKAGKGRTGTMICSYLLHSRICANAEAALRFFNQKRTMDNRGVTIPSQIRYVNYYEIYHHQNLNYHQTTLYLRAMEFIAFPDDLENSIVYFEVHIMDKNEYTSPFLNLNIRRGLFRFDVPNSLAIKGDIKMIFYEKLHFKRTKYLFHFWFNTFFIQYGNQESQIKNSNKLDYQISKEGMPYIFIVNSMGMDNLHTIFSPAFKICLVLTDQPHSPID